MCRNRGSSRCRVALRAAWRWSIEMVVVSDPVDGAVHHHDGHAALDDPADRRLERDNDENDPSTCCSRKLEMYACSRSASSFELPRNMRRSRADRRVLDRERELSESTRC